ncbi:hypothetical protein C8J57DRAFT_1464709 [Mycena rebaudengoi]|nr:hypothetical protein C8J57DRAFT_1464709 [Mycena rebaudengoi]
MSIGKRHAGKAEQAASLQQGIGLIAGRTYIRGRRGPRCWPRPNIGGVDSTGNVVAWVSGQPKCNNVIVGAIGSNPCGRPFNLNGRTFTLQGCGEPLSINTGSGAFFANCGVFSEADACGVHSEFHCI